MRNIFWNTLIQLFTILLLATICRLQEDDIKIAVQIDPREESRFLASQLTETKEVKQQYDYIIVGAGSAGCVLTNRLSEIPTVDVLLIEAGGYESRKMDVPAEGIKLFQTHVDWNYETEKCENCGFGAPVKQKFAYARGKVLGGTSTINGMIYTRGSPEDYDLWQERYKNPGWSFEHVEQYFKKLENYSIYDPENINYFGKNGPMYVGETKYKSRLAVPAIKATAEYGLPIKNTNGPNQVGVSFLQSTVKDGFRFSTNSAYLIPIKGRKNVDLKINCQVTQVLITKNDSSLTADGVKFSCQDGQNYTVLAKKEVILSAGAFNSPQILMLSGIGPANHLEELGIEVLKDLPVGNNFMDHVAATGLEFIVDEPLFPPSNDNNTYYNGTGMFSIPELVELLARANAVNNTPTTEYDFFTAAVAAQTMNEEIYNSIYKPYENQPAFGINPILLKPKSRGYVRLSNSNSFSKPKIIPNFLSIEDDVDTLIKGVKDIIGITQQPSLQELGTRIVNGSFPNCIQYEYASDDYLRCSVRTLNSPAFHASGTCKMGPENDPTTVVDSELRVHGVTKLRVVDASIMPEIIAGHTNGPTIMIAEKAADMIKVANELEDN